MPHDIAPGATSNKPLDPVRRAPRPRRPAAVTGSDHARCRPCVPRRREEEPGRKRDCGWRPGGRRRRRSPSPARRRRHHDDSDGDARQHRGDVPGSFLRHRPRRRQIRRRAVQGPGRRRHPPLARRGAGEGQGPAGEARHRHAGGGEGDAAHPPPRSSSARACAPAAVNSCGGIWRPPCGTTADSAAERRSTWTSGRPAPVGRPSPAFRPR